MDRLSNDPRYKDVVVFTADYDKDKTALQGWKVSDRATVLAFKGKTEKARMTGDTEAEPIRKIFEASR